MKIGLISKGASYPFGHYSSIHRRYPSIEVIGSADWLESDSHTEIAAQGIQSMSLPELLSSQAEIIVIIAPAANHAAATKRVLEAGKHVYCERPIALSLLEVQEIQQLSVEKGLRVACGQDNFLAATWQSVRQALDQGLIGSVLNAQVMVQHRGAEYWMPEPSYLYQPDGIFFDLWYPLQMLVSLFGAIKRLSATSYSNPRARYSVSGQSIPINTPTYVSSVLEFEQNIFVTLVFNIDVLGTSMPAVEIHGTHGIIQAPSPYTWADLAWYKQLSPQKYRIQNLRQPPLPAKRWREYLRQFMKDPRNRWNAIPQSKDAFTSRGCGVAEMSQAILENHPHRTSLDMGIHILEAVLSIQKSAELGIRLDLSTTVARPEPISR